MFLYPAGWIDQLDLDLLTRFAPEVEWPLTLAQQILKPDAGAGTGQVADKEMNGQVAIGYCVAIRYWGALLLVEQTQRNAGDGNPLWHARLLGR